MKRIPINCPSVQKNWLIAILVLAFLAACEHPPKDPLASKPLTPAVPVSYYQQFDFIHWKGEGAMPAAGPGVWEVGMHSDTVRHVRLQLDRDKPTYLNFRRKNGKIRFHTEDPYRTDYHAWMQPYFPDSTLIYFARCRRGVMEYLVMDRYLQPRQYLCFENPEPNDSANIVAAGDFAEINDILKIRLKVIPPKERSRVPLADTSSLGSILKLAGWAKRFPDSEVIGKPEAENPNDPIIIHPHCLHLEGGYVPSHAPLKAKGIRKLPAD